MTVVQIAPGTRESAAGHPSTTPARSNASNAVLNAFKRIPAPAAPAPGGMSRDRIALVHVARRDLHLDEDVYRATLRELAGVSSSKDLTEAGFLAVMARFERLGFKGKPFSGSAKKAAPLGERIGMATPAQLAYMRGLWAQWLGREDEAALAGWVDAKFHVSAIRFMDVVRAQKAIEGLKRMVARKSNLIGES